MAVVKRRKKRVNGNGKNGNGFKRTIPTKSVDYMPNFHDSWALNLMAEGKSRQSAAVEMGVSYSQFKKWEEVEPDFAAAVKNGTALCLAWWEEQARIAIAESNKAFPAVLWMMNMSNRFGWKTSKAQDDKQPEQHKHEHTHKYVNGEDEAVSIIDILRNAGVGAEPPGVETSNGSTTH